MPRLFEGQSGEHLLDFSSVEIKVGWGSVLRSFFSEAKVWEITQFQARGPTTVQFEDRDGRLGLSPPLEIAYRTLRDRLDGVQTDIQLQLGTVSLSGVNLTLDRVRRGERDRLVLVRDAELVAEYLGGRFPKNVIVVGKLEGRAGRTDFNLKFEPDAEKAEAWFKARLLPFDSRRHLLAELPLDFEFKGSTQIEGTVKHVAEGGWALNLEAEMPPSTVFGAGVHGVDQHMGTARLFASVEWSSAQQAVKLLALTFDSAECLVHASGRIGLEEPFRYELNLDPLELRGQGLAMAQRSILGENYIAKPDEGTMAIRGKFSGLPREPIPERIDAVVAIRDVSLEIPSLREVVTGLTIDAELTTSTLRLYQGFAMIQGIPVRLEGELEGRLLAGEVDHAEIRWETSGEASGLSEILSRAAEGEEGLGFSFSGDISGSGVLILDYPEFTDIAGIFERAETRGRLLFHNAEFIHRKLRPRLTKLNGVIEFERTHAVVRNMTGSVEDVDFTLNGVLAGPEHFLRDTITTMTLQADLQLGEIDRYFAWFDRKGPDIAPMEGRLRIEADLRGPLNDWKALSVQGEATIHDFATVLEGPRLAGRVASPQVTVLFSPDRITLRDSQGTWGGLAVRGEGTLTREEGRFEFNLDGVLSDFQKNLPKMLAGFEELGGKATVTHIVELHASRSDGGSTATLAELLPGLAPTGDEETAAPGDLWDLESHGTVRLNNVTVLLHTMPVSARLTQVFGRLRYDDHVMETDGPVTVQPGARSEIIETEARAILRKGGWPESMAFTAKGPRVNLDDWITQWRPPREGRIAIDPSGSPFEPGSRTRMKITLDASFDEFVYRGLEGRSIRGPVWIDLYGGGRTKLVWSNIEASSKGGTVLASGRWLKEEERRLLEFNYDFSKMDVADMLEAFFGESTGRSISTGQATGSLRIARDGPREALYQGEGSVLIENSRITSNAIFSGLGGAIGLEDLFNDITFTEIRGSFKVVDGSVVIAEEEPMVFEHPSRLHPLNMEAAGRIDRERNLDLRFNLHFLPIVEGIPIFGPIWKRLTGRILGYTVRGTLDEPQVSPRFPIVTLPSPGSP